MPPQVPFRIKVTNFSDGDLITYPLAIIRGITPTPFVHLTSLSAPTVSPTISPASAYRFTATHLLTPGPNQLRFSHPDYPAATATITLIFHQPPAALPYVRLVYLLASDSDGSFQSPDPPPQRSTRAALARLHTAGLMIQAATADMMHAHSFPRRTFRLHPTPVVHRMRDLTVAAALRLDGAHLWARAVASLAHLSHRADTVDVAVMSFTRLDAGGVVRAHTALGGGPLALFGGASLFTWPASVAQIGPRLRDRRRFDASLYFDDSGGRASSLGRRACTSTTIGALLHELGHCLSLPHPTGAAQKGGGGIMARGFDDFGRLFVGGEPGEALPFWDRGSAVRLQYHRYLQMEGEAVARHLRMMRVGGTAVHRPQGMREGDAPEFVERDGGVVCRTGLGIGHVGYYKNGDNAAHEEFGDTEPQEFLLPDEAEIRRRCGASREDKLMVSAIDVEGHITDQPYSEIRREQQK